MLWCWRQSRWGLCSKSGRRAGSVWWRQRSWHSSGRPTDHYRCESGRWRRSSHRRRRGRQCAARLWRGGTGFEWRSAATSRQSQSADRWRGCRRTAVQTRCALCLPVFRFPCCFPKHTSKIRLEWHSNTCCCCSCNSESFPVAAARTWNSLPVEVTSSDSLQTF